MKCPNCGIDPNEVTSARCACPQVTIIPVTYSVPLVASSRPIICECAALRAKLAEAENAYRHIIAGALAQRDVAREAKLAAEKRASDAEAWRDTVAMPLIDFFRVGHLSIRSQMVDAIKKKVADSEKAVADKWDALLTAQERAASAEEREKLWLQYRDLLGEEIDSMIVLAHDHGWRSAPEALQRGKDLRAALGIKERNSTA